MTSVETNAKPVKLYEFVDEFAVQARQASVEAKRDALQQHVDEIAAHQLGRGRGQGKPAALDDQISSWQCSNCGSARAGDFNYAGSYRRQIAFSDGEVELRIPRVRCRCGGNVKADFGAALPKRKRHWYDLDLMAVELYLEGHSTRAVKRYFARRDVQVGISSIAGKLAAFREVDINANVPVERLKALSADAAFFRAGGGLRAHYYVHEVLKRDEPLVREGKQVAEYRTGKVLACHLEEKETAQGWERTFEGLVARGVGGPEASVWLVSDGNQGLLSAADLCLPWSLRQRCVWHIGYRARERALPRHKEALERDALWVFGAADVASARGRLERFVSRWREREADAVGSVCRKFEEGVEYLRHPEVEIKPRTVGISERYNQEPKRRFRSMRRFGSERNMEAMTRLIALRHNCLLDRADWLAHAARSAWDLPISAVERQQLQSTQPTPYTEEGT